MARRKKTDDIYADIRRHFLRYHAALLKIPRLEHTRKIEETRGDDGSVTYAVEFYNHRLRHTYSANQVERLRSNDCKVNLFD